MSQSAWFMVHRIRLALKMGTFENLPGQVEVDETYIGSLKPDMHRSERGRKI